MTVFHRTAILSADLRYRYELTRQLSLGSEACRWICFVGLNPSIADALVDDPTIRREVAFARALGANALIKVNLFAYRATVPARLVSLIREQGFSVAEGPDNRDAVLEAVSFARRKGGKGVVLAHGALPKALQLHARRIVETIGPPLYCLGVTKLGEPRHPLYLPKTAELRLWTPPWASEALT